MKPEVRLPVAIVVCPDFSDELEALVKCMHVWIVDTPENKRAADAVWSSNARCSDRTVLTTFKGNPVAGSFDILQAIEDHHNEYTRAGAYN